MCGMSSTSGTRLLLLPVSLGPKAAGRGFLARMLPCEKSVGGISTRRTLSLQPWRSGGKPRSVSTPRCSPPSVPVRVLLLLLLLFVFSRPRSTRRTRRPGETTVPEERERLSEQYESLRTMIGHRWRSTARCERTNERTNERADAPRLSRVGCSPASNM